jgi:hypothetical protein
MQLTVLRAGSVDHDSQSGKIFCVVQ